MHGINAIIKFNMPPQIPDHIKNAFIQKQKTSKHVPYLLLKIKDYEKLVSNILNRVSKKEGINKFDDVKTNAIMACRKRTHKFYYTSYRNFSQYNNCTTPHINKNNKIQLTNDFLNMNSLKNEISNIHEKLTENSFIDKKKEEIYFLLKNAIFPNLKGKIYFIGSCENNIWIKNSDIDSCIVVENCEDKNSYLYILKVIKSAINLIYPSLTVNIIKASVPIAKIYKDQTNICDISINNTVAIVNTQLVSCLCSIDERIPIINRIIKYWAKQKNINNRSQGTFSSYALFLLTYFFFQNLETPLLPSYKSIERASITPFEINSEYFFLQDEVEMPFYTKIEDIKNNFQEFQKNTDDISKLLYGFFEFYSNDVCKNGITLDVYNNQIIENKDMTANIYCPITRKIVNTYSINTWKKMFEKIQAAYIQLKNGSSLNTICEEAKDDTSNIKIDLKDHLLRRKLFQDFYMP
ncbi:nucleotidyltransferase, putative [Plasmodium vinckei petteri]|uniref:Nucleotidyltransferase, putative n=1 Tax=Plasmodium vinckei petteri TaxID=138298 RepID=A0A6V7THJ9_PLAVN|nr:nucleotidyltransferase, putative [Plasmodium vinckei petteri]